MNVHHKKAYLTNFELACEAGAVALIADITWLLHDVAANGISFIYVVIFIGLSVALGLTSYALYRHHKHYVHRLFVKHNTNKAHHLTSH